MTPAARTALRQLAAAATPGPWAADTDANEQQMVLARDADFWVALLPHVCVRSIEVQQVKNAAYIAAVSPDVVTALLDRIDALEAAVRAAEWQGSDACAMPACPFCRRDYTDSPDCNPHDETCIVRTLPAVQR